MNRDPRTQQDHNPRLLLSCEGLSISTDDTNKNTIVENIHLELTDGENICIMGESGSGKTTLVNAIAGIWPRGLKKETGYIDNFGSYIFSVFQDVDLYLDPYQTLFSYIKKAFKKRSRHSTAARPKVDNTILVKYVSEIGLLKPLMEDLQQNVPHDYDPRTVIEALETGNQQEIDRIAHVLIAGLKLKTRQKLSGGEKQKFYILIALIASPDILIADEIFTDIDAGSVNNIIKLLFSQDFTLVFISHDIGMIAELVNKGDILKVFYLKDKNFASTVWRGSGEEHKLAVPGWAEKMLQAYAELKSEGNNNKTFETNAPPIFEISDVTRTFDNGSVVRFIRGSDSDLIIRKGVNYALTGENGAGKTTLFKILTKLSKYKGNIIFFNGSPRELRKVSRYHFVKQNQLVFQKTGNAIVEKMTIKEYLLSFFRKSEHPWGEQRIRELVKEFFEQKCEIILESRFKALSVGEQRRILLIRALLLVTHGGILFVDEAMRGMDIFLKEKLVKYLKRKRGDLQVFLISHDRDLRDALCQEEIILRHDKKAGNTIIQPPCKLYS